MDDPDEHDTAGPGAPGAGLAGAGLAVAGELTLTLRGLEGPGPEEPPVDLWVRFDFRDRALTARVGGGGRCVLPPRAAWVLHRVLTAALEIGEEASDAPS